MVGGGGREGEERYGVGGRQSGGGEEEREVWRGELKGEGKARASGEDETREEAGRVRVEFWIIFSFLGGHGFSVGSAFLCTEEGGTCRFPGGPFLVPSRFYDALKITQNFVYLLKRFSCLLCKVL